MKNKMLVFMAAICSLLTVASGQEPTHTEIKEEVLYEDIKQGARSVAYYKYFIQREDYLGEEDLTFKVMADAYDSDPDIYISRSRANPYPDSSSKADWYCERKGSETCIIQKGQFAVGETLYIGITCARACSYKLRVWFTRTVDLTQSNRRQERFGAYSTHILKFEVPETVLQEPTRSVEIYVQPEHQYTKLDLYLSLDDTFYILEETPAPHLSASGKAVKFTDKHNKWCTKCAVYAILNVYEEDRYYITSVGRVDNDELSNVLPATVFVNPFEQQCYAYFVERSKWDVRIDIEGYTGHADAYVAARTVPSAPGSAAVSLRAAHGANRALALSVAARREFRKTAGTYYLCFYAYSHFSARITVAEYEVLSYFDAIDNQVMTAQVAGGDYFVARYTNTGFTSAGTIRLWLEAQDVEEPGAAAPLVYWSVCENTVPADCSADTNSLGEMCVLGDADARELCRIAVVSRDGADTVAEIPHDPSRCPDAASCTYMFLVSNSHWEGRPLSLLVRTELNDPGDVVLEKTYKNVIKQGHYVPHRIAVSANPETQPYLKRLRITLESIVGDADLFVSQSHPNPTNENSEWKSRLLEPIDEVVIENLSGAGSVDFNRPIYFAVYGNTYSEVEITFNYDFAASHDELLEAAVPVGDGAFANTNIPDEYGERLYSFSPWWSGHENRTSVFLADVLVNKVFFYARWNAYPKHFYTSQHDFNDTIAIYGSSPDAHQNGSYYVRLRPDFALYDLLSARQYIYNMFTFSMTPASTGGKQLAYENMELGETYVGFTNGSLYQDYRFLQMDMRATYNIRLKRIPGQGNPQFYVALGDEGYVRNGRVDDVDAPRAGSAFEGVPYPGREESRKSLRLDELQRSARSPRCGTVRRSAQGDGRLACFVAISVRCLDSRQCAYQLRIDQLGEDMSRQHNARRLPEVWDPKPPALIMSTDFLNGRISTVDEVKYYFFPIEYPMMEEALILLTKPQIFGTGENGDVKVVANILPNVDDPQSAGYKSWSYPLLEEHGVRSDAGPGQPEVIAVCKEKLAETCKDADGCGILMGVIGKSDTLSSYRIKGFYGNDKLQINEPRKVTTSRLDGAHFDYYWFSINDAAEDPAADFEYQVSVGSDGNGDPDLYISLMDGRLPTEADFDLVSNQAGADSIRIERYANSTLWARRNWDPTVGVVVVVGVRVNEPMTYSLVLTRPPPASSPELEMKRLFVGSQQRVDLSEQESQGYSRVYQFYNWLHRDFQISLSVLVATGNVTLMIQRSGQGNDDNNIYTGVPYTQNNSYMQYNVSAGDFITTTIKGSECYSCWYFIRVELDEASVTRHELSISQADGSAGAFATMQVGPEEAEDVFVRGSSLQRRKFLLDSMDNWDLVADVTKGDVEIFIGLDPETVDKGGHIWSASTTQGRNLRIGVKTTDRDFHLATYYFVYIRSISLTNAELTLKLEQERRVEFVGNNHDYVFSLKHPEYLDTEMPQKTSFLSAREQVKFHLFRVPPATLDQPVVFHKVTIAIEPLTPNFYPQVFLKKIELRSEPDSIQDLKYPNLVSYDIAFGENPFFQLNSNKFEYSFVGSSTERQPYYSMAVYQHNWGLSSYTKSAYQIRIEADIISEEEFNQRYVDQEVEAAEFQQFVDGSRSSPLIMQ